MSLPLFILVPTGLKFSVVMPLSIGLAKRWGKPDTDSIAVWTRRPVRLLRERINSPSEGLCVAREATLGSPVRAQAGQVQHLGIADFSDSLIAPLKRCAAVVGSVFRREPEELRFGRSRGNLTSPKFGQHALGRQTLIKSTKARFGLEDEI